jgi:hypothetical protein
MSYLSDNPKALSAVITSLGGSQPPRPSQTHEEWKNSPVTEVHPWLRPDPGPMLAMARWEMRHKRDFQERVHHHERLMQQRLRHIQLLQARGELDDD